MFYRHVFFYWFEISPLRYAPVEMTIGGRYAPVEMTGWGTGSGRDDR